MHGAFGDNRNMFRELEWKTPIFYRREVQKTPKKYRIGRAFDLGFDARVLAHYRPRSPTAAAALRWRYVVKT